MSKKVWETAVKIPVRAVSRVVAGAVGALRDPPPIFYHVVVVVLSAAIAASLPFTFGFIAQQLLGYWSLIENEMIFLVSVEIAVTLVLVLTLSYIRASWKNRTFAKMARAAGMAYWASRKGFLARRRIRTLKERQSRMRDVMIVGSTGFRTFADPKGDLHAAIQHCRAAKIMLLNPYSEGAIERAKSILDPGVTAESLRRQVAQSIEFLKQLRAAQRSIQLKLYPEAPFLKLAILGDYAWVQHYHPGLDVQVLQEYVFVHNQNPGSFYTPFYQYFVTRWNDVTIPEYDLLTDELIYRDKVGNEVRREQFGQ